MDTEFNDWEFLLNSPESDHAKHTESDPENSAELASKSREFDRVIRYDHFSIDSQGKKVAKFVNLGGVVESGSPSWAELDRSGERKFGAVEVKNEEFGGFGVRSELGVVDGEKKDVKEVWADSGGGGYGSGNVKGGSEVSEKDDVVSGGNEYGLGEVGDVSEVLGKNEVVLGELEGNKYGSVKVRDVSGEVDGDKYAFVGSGDVSEKNEVVTGELDGNKYGLQGFGNVSEVLDKNEIVLGELDGNEYGSMKGGDVWEISEKNEAVLGEFDGNECGEVKVGDSLEASENKDVISDELDCNEYGSMKSGGISEVSDKNEVVSGELDGKSGSFDGAEIGDMDSGEEGIVAAEKMKTGGELEKRRVAWWKVPLEFLKCCVFRVNPVVSFSLAAAVMGFLILGRKLYKMKCKSRGLELKVTVDDKKVSQFMSRAARLNEAFSVVRRVPIVRPSLPASGVTQYPAMNLR